MDSAGRATGSGHPTSESARTLTLNQVAQIVDRKIIYTADVSLIVDDYAKADETIRQLVKETGGHISEFRQDATSGNERSGRWVVRIPADKFESFLSDVEAIGFPESKLQNAQDVTEEFVDLDARLTVQRGLEQRILKIVEEREGDIEDVLKAERELTRIREVIETIEGRLRYLTNRTSMTTVTIRAREERDYEPPQAPTFTARVGATWTGSIDSLKNAGQGVALIGVALAPWLPVIIVAVLPLWWWQRRWRKSAHAYSERLKAARKGDAP